jgi:hypothetical protein
MSVEIVFINKIEECIKQYQEKTGATKTWISKKLGLTKVQNLDSLCKSANPTISNLIKISLVLDCDLLDLFDYQIIDNK